MTVAVAPIGARHTRRARRKVRRSFPADLRYLAVARRLMDEVATGAGLEPGGVYRLKLALTEVMANAIQHGSPQPGARVGMRIFTRDGAVGFEVSDTGRFGADAVPIRRAERGRGLAFAFELMDEIAIDVRDDGTVVRCELRTASAVCEER